MKLQKQYLNYFLDCVCNNEELTNRIIDSVIVDSDL